MNEMEQLGKRINSIKASRNSRHTLIIEALQEMHKILGELHEIVMTKPTVSADLFDDEELLEPGIIRETKKQDIFLED